MNDVAKQSYSGGSSKRYPWWGKAGRATPPEHHTALPVHLLAVTAAFLAFMSHPSHRRALMTAWGVRSLDGLMPWLALAVALHDLGKIHHEFQLKRPDVVAWIHGLTDDGRPATAGFDHSVNGGQRYVKGVIDFIAATQGVGEHLKRKQDKHSFRAMLRAAFAHHGYHPRSASAEFDNEPVTGWPARQREGIEATLTHLLAAIAGVVGPFGPIPACRAPAPSMQLLAGWVALADWIGSDEQAFPFINCEAFARDYAEPDSWSGMLRSFMARSQERLNDMGLTRGAVLADWESAVMGRHLNNPRPTQVSAVEIARSLCAHSGSRGALMLIEAPMGVGKTEAALLAAGEFIRVGWAHGVAFGLPAQASANMLHRRMGDLALRVFGLAAANVAHSQSAFVRRQSCTSTYVGEVEGQDSAAHLDEWITDDNKKAFLASLCASTVDQMQLAVMNTKHGFVRMSALTRNVVVIDEVHAYDAYMQTMLRELLAYLGATATPTILLSATLPDAIRQARLQDYARGMQLGTGVSPAFRASVSLQTYPVITTVQGLDDGSLSAQVHGVAAAQTSNTAETRKIEISLATDRTWAIQAAAAARAGACVVILCNTVRSAHQRQQQIQSIAPSLAVTMIHSRYRQQDRSTIQKRIEDFAGPQSTKAERSGRVVVATQVLEQSIDIDADIMFSEPAPIDLSLQRMGRLHRHHREDRGFRARFVIIDPQGADPVWYRSSLKIYGQANKLPASLELLRHIATSEQPSISLPADIPSLVHQVYGEAEDADKTDLEETAEQKANKRVLRHDEIIESFATDTEISSQTRDSDNDTTAILFVIDDEQAEDSGWSIPTEGESIKLPSRFSRFDAEADEVTGKRKISLKFLDACQPWLISIDKESQHGRRIAKHRAREMSHDWRTASGVKAAKDFDPPFWIVEIAASAVHKHHRVDGMEISFEICPGIIYSSRLGLIHA